MKTYDKVLNELKGIIGQLEFKYLHSLLGCARGLLKAQEKETTRGLSELVETLNNGYCGINEQFDEAFLTSLKEKTGNSNLVEICSHIMKLSPKNQRRAELFISGLMRNKAQGE